MIDRRFGLMLATALLRTGALARAQTAEADAR